jgi:antitoxin MazE
MGNSQGVLIPKPLLAEIGVGTGDAVDLKVNKKGRLVIAPLAREPRAGWTLDCKTLAEAGEFGPIRGQSGGPNGRSW